MIEVVVLPVTHRPVVCVACGSPLSSGDRVERVSVVLPEAARAPTTLSLGGGKPFTVRPKRGVYYRCVDRDACLFRLLSPDEERLG